MTYAHVSHVVECNGTIDLAFVLHSAGTVHPERWHYVTQFVDDIIEQLDVGMNRTRVAVITWSDSAHVAFTLDRFAARQDVVQVIITIITLFNESASNHEHKENNQRRRKGRKEK